MNLMMGQSPLRSRIISQRAIACEVFCYATTEDAEWSSAATMSPTPTKTKAAIRSARFCPDLSPNGLRDQSRRRPDIGGAWLAAQALTIDPPLVAPQFDRCPPEGWASPSQ